MSKHLKEEIENYFRDFINLSQGITENLKAAEQLISSIVTGLIPDAIELFQSLKKDETEWRNWFNRNGDEDGLRAFENSLRVGEELSGVSEDLKKIHAMLIARKITLGTIH